MKWRLAEDRTRGGAVDHRYFEIEKPIAATLHRWIHDPGGWYLTCRALGIERVEVARGEVDGVAAEDAAKAEAEAALAERACALRNRLELLLEEIEES